MTLSAPKSISDAFANSAAMYKDPTLFAKNQVAIIKAMADSQLPEQTINRFALKVQGIMLTLARYGWSLAEIDKQCAFVVYKGDTPSVNLQISWRAWATLLRNHGMTLITGRVLKNEPFKIVNGEVMHEGGMDEPTPDNPVVAWYAIIKKNGVLIANKAMNVTQLEKRKALSRRKSQYEQWTDEMAYAKVIAIAAQHCGLIGADVMAMDDDEVYEPLPEEVVPPAPTPDEDRPF